jgi:hypothetical protein
VTLLIQYLVSDEPHVDRFQSGLFTVHGVAKPAYYAFRFPLAQVTRSGTRTSLWGQVRPGKGARRTGCRSGRDGELALARLDAADERRRRLSRHRSHRAGSLVASGRRPTRVRLAAARPLASIARREGRHSRGGTGTRLHPLTRITNKHLLPLGDRPMVAYAIEALVRGGITELMVVTGGTHAGEFLRLLGNGHEFGIDRLAYGYQEQAGGIAEALGLAERFVGGDRVCVMLADNVFERSIKTAIGQLRTAGARRQDHPRAGEGRRAPAPPRRARVRRRRRVSSASSRSRSPRRASSRDRASTSTTRRCSR